MYIRHADGWIIGVGQTREKAWKAGKGMVDGPMSPTKISPCSPDLYEIIKKCDPYWFVKYRIDENGVAVPG